MEFHPQLPDGVDPQALLAELRRLCWGAADILRAYGRGEAPPYGFPPALSVDHGGEGPVSAADLAVNQWLLEGLRKGFPQADWTLLSEETAGEQLREGIPLEAEWLWILDPLDGTKDFLQGTGEYAVHLALVRGQRPVLGVVLLPEPEELWFGMVGDGPSGGPGEAWRENRAGDRFAPSPQRPAGLRRAGAGGQPQPPGSTAGGSAEGPGAGGHPGGGQCGRQGGHDPAGGDGPLHLAVGEERPEGLGHGRPRGGAAGRRRRLQPCRWPAPALQPGPWAPGRLPDRQPWPGPRGTVPADGDGHAEHRSWISPLNPGLPAQYGTQAP